MTGRELLTLATARPGPGRRSLSPRAAFWCTTGAYTAVMAVGTAPTPLWPLYQATGRIRTTTISVLAGAVVVGATVSFLLLGHLSDRHGRRAVLIPAVLTSALALGVMAAFPSIPGLLAGRVLTGLALGVSAPTATAYLLDLHRAVRGPAARLAGATTVATAANLGGLAVGPVLAGTLAALVPAPMVTPYLVLASALTASAALLLLCPETVAGERRAGRPRQRFAVLPGRHLGFAGAAAGGFVSFAVTGVFSTLGAIVVGTDLAVHSVLVWGLATALVFTASAVAQLAVPAWSARRLFLVGVAVLPAGLAVLVYSVSAVHVGLYLLSSAVAGAACGLLFKAGLTTSAAVSVPEARAGVLAVYFSTAYLGMGLGAVGLASLERVLGTVAAFVVVFGLLAALAVAGARAVTRDR